MALMNLKQQKINFDCLTDEELYKNLDFYKGLQSKGIYDEMMIMLMEVELMERGLEI